MSIRLSKRKTHRDYTNIPVVSTGWGWHGRAANLSLLPLKVKTFWDSVVWFHPGGYKSGWSHPDLRKNKVFLFTVFFFSFFLLEFIVFLGVM